MQPAPPCPAPTCWWQKRASGLLLHLCLYLVRWKFCVVCLFVCFSIPGYVALCESKNPHRHTCERVSYCVNFSFMTPFPGGVSLPKSFVTVFVFYILSYLLLKRLGCIFGCLVFSASVQKIFCGSFPAFKWTFDEFVADKVLSPSYSSTVLGLHTPISCIFIQYV